VGDEQLARPGLAGDVAGVLGGQVDLFAFAMAVVYGMSLYRTVLARAPYSPGANA